MSGAEFLAVIGGISAIISIADKISDVYKTVQDVRGVPEAFSVVAGHLPIVKAILESAKHHIDEVKDEAVCTEIQHIVKRCETNAETLKTIFDEVKPSDGAWKVERYYKAVKAKGKGSKVESLMANILEDVRLLGLQHGMRAATEDQQKEVLSAIKELSEVMPSVPDSEFHEAGVTMNQSGSGTQQYTAQGNVYSSGGGKQFNAERQYFASENVETHEERCMQALFLSDPRDDRAKIVQAKGSRVEGTCEWIKGHPLYISWLQSHSQLLWLSGGPGKGKTMLSVFLAEELERTTHGTENYLFLQYFCDNQDENRNTAVAIMRGMIFQLLTYRQELMCHILPSFQIQQKSLFKESSFETLWRIFNTMLQDPVLSDLYCVLDGLDECDESSLEILVAKFKSLFSLETRPSHRLKLIVVSRNIPRFIPEQLNGFPRIQLDTDSDGQINDDLQKFINDKVEQLPAYSLCPERLQIRLKENFRDRAQGTFLWVGLVAEALRKCGATELKDALDEFPPGLDRMYDRMLLQIDARRKEIAAKVLLWVVMAVRPLTLSELGTAIELDIKCRGDFSIDQVTRDQVVNCGSLLSIDSKTDEVRLVHQSAKDYLLRKTPHSNPDLEPFRIKEEAGTIQVAKKCFDYLHNGAFANGAIHRSDTAHLKTFPFISYATLYWLVHAQAVPYTSEIFDLSLPFYQTRSQIRKSWLKTYRSFADHDELDGSSTLLHLASYFGVLPLAKRLVKNWWISPIRHLNVNKMNRNGRTSLHYAVTTRLKTMAQLLLENGANIEAKDNHGHTVLAMAILLENMAMVQFLLENGANIEANDNLGHTVLALATRRGNMAIVQFLLEKGANMEAKDSNDNTVLAIAVIERNKAMVQFLLENGANIEAKDIHGSTVLTLAVLHENKATVQFLLEKGANIEAKGDLGDTVLALATRFGNKAMVQLLLEKGANIEAKDTDGNTILVIALFRKDTAMVQFLLEKGANIEAKDKTSNTPIFYAAAEGCVDIVRLLLDKGGDPNVRNIKGHTALMLAMYRGHMAVVDLLRPFEDS